MTKKDYQLIADAIRESIQGNPQDVDQAWDFLMMNLATAFKEDNQLFDRNKFYAAVFRARKGE